MHAACNFLRKENVLKFNGNIPWSNSYAAVWRPQRCAALLLTFACLLPIGARREVQGVQVSPHFFACFRSLNEWKRYLPLIIEPFVLLLLLLSFFVWFTIPTSGKNSGQNL